MRTVLVVRLDSAGDVLLAGPAVRAPRRSFGAAGRERAVRHYAMDRVVAGTLRAYAATAHAATSNPGMRA